MRFFLLAVAVSLPLLACTAPTSSDDDADFDPNVDVSESELGAGSSVGRRYAVTGTFVLRSVPTMNNRNPAETVLGDGGARFRITRNFTGPVSGFIGNHFDKIAANVRITYRSADGASHVVTALDRAFEPEAGGYGPFTDVVSLSGVELGVQISDFGKREMFMVSITPPAPNGKEILFRPKTVTGPF